MPALLRYGIAILSVAIAIGLGFFLLQYFEAKLTPFLFAIATTVWYAGTGPGVLAIVLSVFSLNYFFLSPFFSFSPISYADLVYLTFCTFCALAVGWVSAVRRRAEQELRQARDELEAKVLERTANLQRSESYLTETQKLTHTGSWAWDVRSQRVLYCSEEMFRIYGLDPQVDLPTRKNFRQRVHPEDRNRTDERFVRVVNEKVDSFDEYRVLLPDGTVKHVNSSGHPVLDGNGELIAFIGTATDVTERKRAEKALRESEAKIRRLVDSNIIGIFVWDFDGRIVEANDEFLRMVNYDREDLVSGRIRWAELTPPDWRDRNNARIEQQKSGGRFEPFEKEYTRKDGSRVPVLIGGATFEEGGNQGVAFVLDLTERKRAEQALVRSEAYLAETQKLTHTGTWAWDARSQTVLFCSEEMFRIYGLDPQVDLPTRRNFRQRVHSEDRSGVDERQARVFNEKVGSFDEFRIVLPDGTVKHVSSSWHPALDGNGELIELIGTATDITERKRGEQALQEREAELAEARRELRQMIDTIPIPVASYSADARRDFVNAAWKQYTGLSDEAALGTEWSVVAHPDDVATGEKMWHDAFATGVPWHTEERVRRADGQYRWFAIDRVAARDENGKIIKWYGTAYDIEDRKRGEERLRVQHTVAQILAEAATIEEATPRILRAMGECLGWDLGTLWRVDREAGVLRCVELWHKVSVEVPEFERVSRKSTFVPGLGLPGRVWSSLEPEYVPDVVPDENFPRAPIAEREGLHAAFGFPILLAGEVLGAIEFFSREIRQPDQELLNMLATIGSQIGQFIERKLAEEAFRKAQLELAHANRVATMGQLSASITHEVNQPITAAVTYALAARRWLSAEPPNFHEVDDALSLIVKEGNRAGEIVGRIRALIKKAPPRKDAVAINDAILEVVALTRTEAANSKVSVRTQLAEGLPHVQGDRVQLQQVLLNLIINAIEAMRDVGETERELLVSTRNEPEGVSVEVRDSGPGFAPAALEHVFEAFYTTKPGGLGLGLSICRSIIEAHNGRLWASPNVPRGAIFRFITPAHSAAAS
jgi:PAS domain S-box-containing protein